MTDDRDVPMFKVVLMGDSGVGKTSIVLQLSEHVFRDITKPTVGSGCIEKRVNTSFGTIKLNIWDTAGEERYRSVTSLYSQGAEAFVVVFDVADESTFESIPEWIETFHQTSNASSLIYVVGNKNDLPNRAVTDARAYDWCQKNGYSYYDVSAKTGERVELVFTDIAEKLGEKSNRMNQSVVTPLEAKRKEGCC